MLYPTELRAHIKLYYIIIGVIDNICGINYYLIMRAIGLDLGSKTLGIAITDSLKIIATGLENFEYQNHDLNICVDKLKQIFKKYSNDIDTIVLGKPKRSNNKPSEMTLLSDEFKNILEQNFKAVKIIQ